MQSRPDLGPKPLLGYTASILARVAERRGDKAFLAACAAEGRACAFAIGGELVVMRKTANGPDPLFRAEEARALAPHRRDGVSRSCRRGRPLRHRARSRGHRGTEGAPRSARHRPALDRRAGTGRPRASGAARRGEGAARLACAASLLRQLRPADRRVAGRLEARMPGLQGRAFPAHRSGRDHAGDRRRSLPARARGPLRAEHVVLPCGLRRAGRDHRGSGAARDAGGSRHRLRASEVFRLAALAVPDVADDRLPCAGDVAARSRSTARSSRTRAGSPATRSR